MIVVNLPSTEVMMMNLPTTEVIVVNLPPTFLPILLLSQRLQLLFRAVVQSLHRYRHFEIW
jgi:hypothetical protein